MNEDIISKYEMNVLKNIDKENMQKIINFLEKENCSFIEDMIEDYLDLFTIDYEEFVSIYNTLNKKYSNDFLFKVSLDMNLLEEFY